MIKKIFTSLILIMFLFGQFQNASFCAQKRVYQTAKKKVSKTAQVAKKPQKPNSQAKPEPKEDTFKIPLIEDEAVKSLKGVSLQKYDYTPFVLDDSEAVDYFRKVKTKKKKYKKVIIEDENVIEDSPESFQVPQYTGIINEDSGVQVRLKPVHKIHTRSSRIKIAYCEKKEKYSLALPVIGETVEFKVVKNVLKNDKVVIPKDTIVYAKVGEVSPRGMGGAPAEMTLEDFETIRLNGKSIKLNGDISSSGYSLSVWIGLAELATTPFLFGLAVPLLRVLPGGQAVITPRKEYVVYY